MAKPLKVAHPPNFILANIEGSQMILGVLIDANMTKKLALIKLVILPTVGRKMDLKLENGQLVRSITPFLLKLPTSNWYLN